MTIFRYALIRSFSNWTNIIALILFPLLMIVLPSGQYWPLLPYGYQYFGVYLLFVSIRLASLIIEERVKGVTKRIAVSPVSYFQYLGEHLLAYTIILFLQCVILVYGGVLLGIELYHPQLLLLLYTSYSIFTIALALAWISIFRSKSVAFLVYMSVVSMLSTLGGLLLPITIFPAALTKVAMLLPTYWLGQGFDWVVSGGAMSEYWLIQGILLIYALIFFLIGSVRKLT